MKWTEILLAITAVLTALNAGLFFAWSISVMTGLARVSDKVFISFMQAANRAIQNPLFLAVFFGTQLLLPVSTLLNTGIKPRFWLLLAATIFYTIGVMAVTIFGNVPLNNNLEKFNLENSSAEEITNQRKIFERRWTLLNNLRTFFSFISIVLIIFACFN